MRLGFRWWLREWRIKMRQEDVRRFRKRTDHLWRGIPWTDEEVEQFLFGDVLKPL